MSNDSRITRRQAISTTGAVAAGLTTLAMSRAIAEDAAKSDRPAVKNGRINQSIVQWCFKDHWDMEKTCQVAKQLGCKSVEILTPEHFATVKKYDLTCACVSSHGFKIGMNDPADWR